MARRTANRRIITLDSYRRPYSRKDYRELVSAIDKEELKGRVSTVVSDYSYWLSRQTGNKFDGVISSEFLPEIDSADMRKFLSECSRVMKPGSVTVHSFLSPGARNPRQRLLIEADSDPRWTQDPPKQWFSPHPNGVADEMRRAGFQQVKPVRIESRLVFRAKAARTLLREWDVRDAFWRKHQQFLRQEGLELPDWVVMAGVKPGR